MLGIGWSKSRVSPIGIDFGADTLKLLQIVPGDPPQFVAAASASLPSESSSDPDARLAFYAGELRKLIKSQPFKGNRVMLSIPAAQMLVQNLQIPKGDDAEAETQVGLQLRDRLNVNPSRMVVRSIPVAQVVRDGAPRTEVVCMAAGKEAVMRYLELARRAHLEVVGMHSEPMAIIKAFSWLFRREADAAQTTCFVDLGALTTKVVVTHGGELMFAKVIHAGGAHLNRKVAEKYEIDVAEARKRRAEAIAVEAEPRVVQAQPEPVAAPAEVVEPEGTGFAILDAQLATDASRRQPEQLVQMPAPDTTAGEDASLDPLPTEIVDCLIDELQLCVRYHQSLFPDRQIDKLVFLGGESRHVQLCQRIARSLRVGAQAGDPLARLHRGGKAGRASDIEIDQPQPAWAVPMGLCTSEANL